MIKTSYFAKYKGTQGVSIAVSHPPGFKGKTCDVLYPPKALLTWYKHHEGIIKSKPLTEQRSAMKQLQQTYAESYAEDVLKRLTPLSVYKALDGKVLLCWEKSGTFCHRHIVAQWLRDAGFQVEEFAPTTELKGMSTRQKRGGK